MRVGSGARWGRGSKTYQIGWGSGWILHRLPAGAQLGVGAQALRKDTEWKVVSVRGRLRSHRALVP